MGEQQSVAYDEEYYRSGGYENLNTGLTGQYYWARRFYAGLVKHYCTSGRVLEIGCGLGHVLARLQDRYDAYGIDVSAYAVEQAQHNAPRAQAEVLPVEQIAKYGPQFFDAMIAVHVYEHLTAPEEVARLCYDALRPGGVLIMATPNLTAPLKTRKGDRWFGYKDPTHINMKPPGEWLRMLQRIGFRKRRVFGDGMWDVPYVPVAPAILQLLMFGLPAILQTVTGVPLIPVRFSESLIAVMEKPREPR